MKSLVPGCSGSALRGVVGLVLLVIGAALSQARAEDRTLTIYNIHTKETVSATYKRNGRYDPEGLRQLSHIMRDWRRNEVTRMDPALFDLIWEMHRELGSREPVHLISGYRSPATNAALRKTRGGQARFSRHMVGQAADIQFPDIPLKQLRDSALIRERGGVGYYPASGKPFVHVDTGNVRHWPRLPRQELAVLFPSGRSQHVPADGRPITAADHRVALASLKARGGELPWALDRRRQRSQPMLASLGPATLPGFAKPERPAPRAERSDLEATIPAGLMARPPSLAAASPAAPFAMGGSPETGLSEEGEEHEDEMLFEPLPIIQLLTDKPVSHIEIHEEQRPIFAKMHLILSAPNTLASAEFEEGLQIENMYAAHRFQGGPAVSFVQQAAWAGHQLRPAQSPALTSAQLVTRGR